jgi:DNA repair protein RecO (recombination protein O)
MEERSSGLILRTRLLTETSLIVHWLTADCGRLATVAKGARRARSPFRGKLDLFYLCDLSFIRSKRSDLHLLREVSVRDLHAGLREDWHKLQQAAYAAALIEQTTETETPLPVVFDLLLAFLRHLPVRPGGPSNVFAFEMKLLAELGLKPDLGRVRLAPGTRLALGKLAGAEWPAVSRLRLSRAQTREIRQFLQGFLLYHLGRLPPSRTAALGASAAD